MKNKLLTIALVVVIGFSFAACDNNGNSGRGVVPAITTSALPNGVVGTTYSQTLVATGDTPITWSLESGELPIGLNLLRSGVISGMPITSGTSTFAVTATNPTGNNTKEFSIRILPVGGNPDVDTTALNAVILEAGIARTGVETASLASEVPKGKFWVTESVWNALDSVYKAAAETRANPSSQPDVDNARNDLQAALDYFNTTKKPGSAAAITLSGTITVKNKGQIVPYVLITPHTDDWSWAEDKRVHITGENTPWSINTKPFSSPTEIIFRITGYDNDKYENNILEISIDDLKRTVYDMDVPDIIINKDLNLITVRGTLNLDYNGKEIPSVSISIDKKEGGTLGSVEILHMRNNASWSINIPSQAVDTDITFGIVGFDGPLAWQYDRLIELWNQDFGVKVRNQDKSGIAINLITISGTYNFDYNGRPVPTVDLHFFKGDWEAWLGMTTLLNPSANTPWSWVIPAFTGDTSIRINVDGKDTNGAELFGQSVIAATVKDTNVSGIALNFIQLSGTVNVTYKGNRVPVVHVPIHQTVPGSNWEWLAAATLYNPPANAPWSVVIPAYTSDTELWFGILGKLEVEGPSLFADRWSVMSRTVKDTNVSGIVLDLGNITD